MLAGKVAEWSKALVLGFNSSHQSERAWVRIPPLSIFLFFFFYLFFFSPSRDYYYFSCYSL